MSPPPEAWEDGDEDGEQGEAADADDAGAGYEDDEEYSSDSDYSDDGSSSYDSGPQGHCWPDPFDDGTEASTPAGSARPSVVDLPSVSPARPLEPDDCQVGRPWEPDGCMVNQGVVLPLPSPSEESCNIALAGDWRQCPPAVWTELHSQFIDARQAAVAATGSREDQPRPLEQEIAATATDTSAGADLDLGTSCASSSSSSSNSSALTNGDFRIAPPNAWAALWAQFRTARPHSRGPEAPLEPPFAAAVAAAPRQLAAGKRGGAACSGARDGDLSRSLPPASSSPPPLPPQPRPHHGRPRGRPASSQPPCGAIEKEPRSSPVATPPQPPRGAVPCRGDFRACPASFWEALHCRSGWPSLSSRTAATGGLLGGVGGAAAGSQEEVAARPDESCREPKPPQTPPEAAAALASPPVPREEGQQFCPYSREPSGDDEDSDSDSEDEDERVGFFISTGGALDTVPEEESCDLRCSEEGPSASLQAYVAATGALIATPQPPCDSAPRDVPSPSSCREAAASRIQHGWRRRCQAHTVAAAADAIEPVVPPPCMEAEQVQMASPELPTEPAAPEVEVEAEASCETGPSTEDFLRAQIEAKQVLMSAVLKVIFSMRLTEEPSPPANDDSACSFDPVPESSPPPAQVEEESAPAPEPAVQLEGEEVSEQAAIAEVVETPGPEVAKPPGSRPGSGRRLILGSKTEASRRSTCKDAANPGGKVAAGKKLIRSPWGRSAPTQPRQPPPRPDKRPPVPRAPRPSSARRASASSSPSGDVANASRADAANVGDSRGVEAQAASPGFSYEVSDEEFARLLGAGALQGCGQGEEAYEISEEEFERLMQAGQLREPGVEDEASSTDVRSTPSPGLEGCLSGPGADALEVSDEQFQQLLLAGALRPDQPELLCPSAGSCSRAPSPEAEEVDEEEYEEEVCSTRPQPSQHCSGGVPRRHSAPRVITRTSEQAPAAQARCLRPPARPGQAKAAPRRARKVETGGGLFFLPTDGVPAVGSRSVAGGCASVPFQSSAEAASRASWNGSRAPSAASSTEVMPMQEEAPIAGSPLHSAQRLRERCGPARISQPTWQEEPLVPPAASSQRRPPRAPPVPALVGGVMAAGKLPRILRAPAAVHHGPRGSNRSELGNDGAPSAPCVFGEDGRGFSPFDDDEDDAWAECRSLPAKLSHSGRESREASWSDGRDGVLHFCGLPGKRVPRKLVPLC